MKKIQKIKNILAAKLSYIVLLYILYLYMVETFTENYLGKINFIYEIQKYVS